MKTKKWFSSMIIIGGVLILQVSCSNRADEGLAGSGTLEAVEVLVSAKMAGTVMEIFSDEGDRLQAGQVIAVIDSEKIALQKKQLAAGLRELRLNMQNARRGVQLAKDNLDNVEKKYNRVKSLLAEDSATQQQMDDVEIAYKAAVNRYETVQTSSAALGAKESQLLTQIELAESQLRDAVVTAPIVGTVIEKYVERGEVTRPGGPIVKLADLDNMWIKIYVNEAKLAQIRLGGRANVRITSREDSFDGTISWISSKAEFTPRNVQTREARADLVYAVKITMKNKDGILKIGMPADVYLN